ncbi:Transcriptional regulatory protein, partial [Rhizophlyctis rosea]
MEVVHEPMATEPPPNPTPEADDDSDADADSNTELGSISGSESDSDLASDSDDDMSALSSEPEDDDDEEEEDDAPMEDVVADSQPVPATPAKRPSPEPLKLDISISRRMVNRPKTDPSPVAPEPPSRALSSKASLMPQSPISSPSPPPLSPTPSLPSSDSEEEEEEIPEPFVTPRKKSISGAPAAITKKDLIEKEPEPEVVLEETNEQENLRKEALQAIIQIERDFATFRDRMYHEKIADCDREAEAIANGTHPILVGQLEEMEQKKTERLRIAESRTKQLVLGYHAQFEASVYITHKDFISRRRALRHDLIERIQGKRWRMNKEKRVIDSLDRGETAIALIKLMCGDRAAVSKRRKVRKSELNDWKEIISKGGFPACSINGLNKNEVQEDFDSLGIVSRVAP